MLGTELSPSQIASQRAAFGATPLRVSIIGSLPPVKGVSPYTRQLLDALHRHGEVEVEFVGFRSIYPRWAYPGGEPAEQGVAPEWMSAVPVRRTLSWYNPFSWIRAGFGVRGDVVHAQWWSHVLAPVYATVLGLARLRGKRVLLTVHNVTPHESSLLNRLMLRLVLMFGHEYIVHSEDNRARLEEMRGSRATVLPHGVLDAPRKGMTREEARATLGIAPEAKVALAFGNIRPYKGIDVLLRAFAKIAGEQPNALLLIAGKPWESWDRYEALIQQMHLGDRVRLFLDYVPTSEVETFFEAADVVALPYRGFDAQSGVGALALPFGRALIVSAAGGLPEFVFDPDAVVTPGDEESLAESLGRALADDVWRKKLEHDSEQIAARLGWTEIAEQTVAIYRDMAGRAEEEAVEVTTEERAPVEAAGAPVEAGR